MAKIEVYSSLSFEDAVDVDGKNIDHPRLWAMHQAMIPLLRVMNVVHFSYENPTSEKLVQRQGQIVVHYAMQQRFHDLFEGWQELRYPIEHARPISQTPGSNDKRSMALNRTLVYRPDVVGEPNNPDDPPSEHYRGSAVDVNPFHNPIINPDHTVEPAEAVGHKPRLAMVVRRLPDVIGHALDLDFEWGGDWDDARAGKGYYGVDAAGQPRDIVQDPHHFELVPDLAKQLEMPEAA